MRGSVGVGKNCPSIRVRLEWEKTFNTLLHMKLQSVCDQSYQRRCQHFMHSLDVTKFPSLQENERQRRGVRLGWEKTKGRSKPSCHLVRKVSQGHGFQSGQHWTKLKSLAMNQFTAPAHKVAEVDANA